MAEPRPSGRLGRLGLLGARSAVIVLALILLVAAGHRLDVSWDATPLRSFSLSPEFRAILADIDHPVAMIGVWQPTRLDPHDRLREALVRIAAASDQLDWRLIDALRDQPRLDALEERLGFPPLPDSLYLLRDDRPPQRVALHRASIFSLQRDIAGALRQLARERPVPVHPLRGHGELSDQPGQAAVFFQHLQRSGFALRPAVDAAAVTRLGRLPDDGVLVIAGPQSPLGDEVIAALQRYLIDGGRLLVLADHRCPDDLRQLLQQWSIRPGLPGHPGTVIKSLDQALRLSGRPFDTLIAQPLGGQPSAERIAGPAAASGRLIVSPRSVPVLALDWESLDEQTAAERRTAGLLEPLLSTALLRISGDDLWLARPDDDRVAAQGDDQETLHLARVLHFPPHPQAVDPDRGARIIVWGSREALTDRWLEGDRFANALLAGEMVAHLAALPQERPIPLQQFQHYMVHTSPTTTNLLAGLLAALLPSICIGVAILAWWERR